MARGTFGLTAAVWGMAVGGALALDGPGPSAHGSLSVVSSNSTLGVAPSASETGARQAASIGFDAPAPRPPAGSGGDAGPGLGELGVPGLDMPLFPLADREKASRGKPEGDLGGIKAMNLIGMAVGAGIGGIAGFHFLGGAPGAVAGAAVGAAAGYFAADDLVLAGGILVGAAAGAAAGTWLASSGVLAGVSVGTLLGGCLGGPVGAVFGAVGGGTAGLVVGAAVGGAAAWAARSALGGN